MSLNEEQIRDLKKRVVTANVAMGYWLERMGVDHTRMYLGNISSRIPGTNLMLIKGRTPENDLMSETTLQKIVTVNIETVKKVEGGPDVYPANESDLHSAIYVSRPDVKAIAHGHGDFTILASLLELDLKPFCTMDLELFNPPIPISKTFAIISTPELGYEVAKCMGMAKAILLRGHGSVTVSNEGPEDVIQRLMNLEDHARLNFYAFSAVGKDYTKYAISEKERLDLIEKRKVRLKEIKRPGVSTTIDMCKYNARMARLKR